MYGDLVLAYVPLSLNIRNDNMKKFIYKFQCANTGSCENTCTILHKTKRNKRHTHYIYNWQKQKYIRTYNATGINEYNEYYPII